MIYEPEQKGLFTFYKEQEQIQDQIKKNKKIKLEKQKKTNRIKLQRVEVKTSFSKQSKIDNNLAQKALKEALRLKKQRQIQLKKIQMLENYRKKYGESVLVINKNGKMERMQICEKEKRERKMNTGHYLENKSIDFSVQQQDQTKKKNRNKKSPKVVYFNKATERYNQESHTDRMKFNQSLPLITKKMRNSEEEPIRRLQHKALKSNNPQLMSQIKKSLNYEKKNINNSVSYIEYNKNMMEQTDKELNNPQLNYQQRRILDLLQKYKEY